MLSYAGSSGYDKEEPWKENLSPSRFSRARLHYNLVLQFFFHVLLCLATLAAYSHFPGQFSGEGKIMQAMQTHLGVGRNLEIQDLGVFPEFIIVQLVNLL